VKSSNYEDFAALRNPFKSSTESTFLVYPFEIIDRSTTPPRTWTVEARYSEYYDLRKVLLEQISDVGIIGTGSGGPGKLESLDSPPPSSSSADRLPPLVARTVGFGLKKKPGEKKLACLKTFVAKVLRTYTVLPQVVEFFRLWMVLAPTRKLEGSKLPLISNAKGASKEECMAVLVQSHHFMLRPNFSGANWIRCWILSAFGADGQGNYNIFLLASQLGQRMLELQLLDTSDKNKMFFPTPTDSYVLAKDTGIRITEKIGLAIRNLSDIVSALRSPLSGLKTITRNQTVTVVARDLVSWLVVAVPDVRSRLDGVAIGAQLLRGQFIVRVHWTGTVAYGDFLDNEIEYAFTAKCFENFDNLHSEVDLYAELRSFRETKYVFLPLRPLFSPVSLSKYIHLTTERRNINVTEQSYYPRLRLICLLRAHSSLSQLSSTKIILLKLYLRTIPIIF
jgi:hypothetical protein